MSPKSLKNKVDETQRLGCITEDLYVIHGFFRNSLSRADRLVALTSPQDQERIKRIADYLEYLLDKLENHHIHEDVVLWDRLSQRAPEIKEDVERMKTHHNHVSHSIEELRSLISQWRSEPAKADQLAERLKEFYKDLDEHLSDEESSIRPVASRVIKQAEWNIMKDMGFKEIPKNRLMIELGLMLQAAPNETLRQGFWDDVPKPAQLLYKLFGKKQFEKEWNEIYGPIEQG